MEGLLGGLDTTTVNTETIHVIETEFTDDGPVNVTRDGRRIPAPDIIVMKAVVIEAFGRTAWLR